MKGKILSRLVGIVLLGTALLVLPMSGSVSGTGALGNQPETGYIEGSERFEITKNDFTQTHTTSFAPGETIRVVVASSLVDLLGNSEETNEAIITDFHNFPESSSWFYQEDSGGEHVYNTTLQAPSVPDHYLLTVRIVDQSGNVFLARDVIIVGDGATNQKYIKTFADNSYSTADWTFTNLDTVYLEVYAEEEPSDSRSRITFADYSGGESVVHFNGLSSGSPNMNGNYVRIEYDLTEDLDPSQLSADSLSDGFWYTLTASLHKGNDDAITQDWSTQILITDIVVPTLSLTEDTTQADPGSVEREGVHSTTISAHFQDTDEPAADSFDVTFKVRDQDMVEYVIVNGKSNGQSGEYGGTVSITSSGGGTYTASYNLDPDSSFDLGNYDLYFMVEDGTGESAEDPYHRNSMELYIMSSTSAPHVNLGATQCVPYTVDRIGPHVTTISTQFSDSDSLEVNDFTVLFAIQDPSNDEFILVDNKTHGQPGEYGGDLSITSSAEGTFTASYTFDPDATFTQGRYDLYFKVTDETGNSDEDNYFWNRNGLEITSSAEEPEVTAGATQVTPGVVEKGGTNSVMVSAHFSDADSDSVSNFTVTFAIRDTGGNEYMLVDRKHNGGTGEYGETLTITSTGPNEYTASYLFNPPSTLPSGNFSLYFKVEDEYGSFAEDEFSNNQNELLITGEGEEETENGPNFLCPFILIIVVIVIVLLILVSALNKRGKKETPHGPQQVQEQVQPPPPYDYTSYGPPQVPPQPGEFPPPPPQEPYPPPPPPSP